MPTPASDRPLASPALPPTQAPAGPAEIGADTDPGPNPDDWLRTAREAREAGRVPEARRLLDTAARRFPDSPDVRHDAARIAETMRDWPAAEPHWRAFLGLATHLWWAYTSLANVLREQGRRQEADAALTGQFDRFADEPWMFFEYALLAERTADWPEAAKRWAAATARFPHLWDGYSGHARALRQLNQVPAARRLLTAAAGAFPNTAQPCQDIAHLAEADHDWVAAEQAWRGFLAHDEDRWWGHTGLAHALRRQRRFDAADGVLSRQFARFPEEPALLFEHAAVAEHRGDWAQAAERYRTLVHKHPDRHHGALGLAYMLARLGRRAEADDVLRQAIETHPAELGLRQAFARNVAEIGPAGAPEFLQRTRQTLAVFPDEPEAHGFLADALTDNVLFEDAEACLASACARFPADAALLRRWAASLAQQSKWDDALAAFDALDRAGPPDPRTECDRARMLITAARWDAADARLTAALGRFPEAATLHLLRLDSLIGRLRLDAAIDQWRAIERRFPAADVGGVLHERRTRLLGLGRDPVETAGNRPAAPADQHRSVRIEEIVMEFESLGGWGLGCEFGLFQRHLGVEPLGLLRWADIDTDGLAEALESGFDGIGQPDQTRLETAGGALDEYVSVDRRFGMRLHTYVPAGQVTPERMLAQTCRRLSFLRQKLLDDLHRAEKIFVYRHARRTLTDQEQERLRLAIRRYGDNTLLYVRHQNEQHRFASVTAPEPGLLVGHMDKMGLMPDGAPLPIPFDSWATLVLQAHARARVAV
jgi:tetratricopeptide (TPR) repeat protein